MVPTALDRVAAALAAVAVTEKRVRTVTARLAAEPSRRGAGPEQPWFGGFTIHASATGVLLAAADAYAAGDPPRLGPDAALTAPVWVIPAVVASHNPGERAELVGALAEGLGHDALVACEVYAAVAADALAGDYSPVNHASPTGINPATAPAAVDDGPATAMVMAAWAVGQPAPLQTLLRALEPTCGPVTLAAVAGITGLRDGLATLPPRAYRDVPQHPHCLAAAQRLVHTQRSQRPKALS